MNLTGEQCQTCKFWFANTKGPLTDGDPALGRCHRYPPTVFSIDENEAYFKSSICDGSKQAVANMARAINQAKADWLDAQMKRIMPPTMYALAQDAKGSGRERMKLAKWLTAKKVVMQEQPNVRLQDGAKTNGDFPEQAMNSTSTTRLMFGEELISEFLIRYKDGKIETRSLDYPFGEFVEVPPCK